MNEQTGGAGRRDDTQDQLRAEPARDATAQPSQQGDGAETGASAGGAAEGAQGADAPGADHEVGRVGESPRKGQGGYGNDTGFVGGTQGATDEGSVVDIQADAAQAAQDARGGGQDEARQPRDGGMR
jgi:hypothetical protein